jgi:predicted ATPase/DNA-binding winged helix-turn-helix (wHTH) protein
MTQNLPTLAGDAVAFGTFRLDLAQRVLMEGDREVRLGSRAFEILLALLETPGEVVTKNKLMERIWPNVVVEEGTLRVHIASLRKALGDGRSGMRYVENVTGHGYRMIAPVTSVDSSVSSEFPSGLADVCPISAGQCYLVGRDDVVAALVKQVPAKRFVTIVGAGGIGKTTVALAAAQHLRSSYAHGVYCIDLSGVGDPARVVSAVASAFRLPVFSDNPLPNLVEYLAQRQLLIVLDNCEHVIEAAAQLAEAVLRRAFKVDLLATSREPLRAEGEWVQRLAPLDLPPDDQVSAADALGYSAIRLFVERAMASSGSFELLDEDVALVVEICRKLDGLPLAIELAAASVGLFGVRGLAARLESRLQILKTGRRTALPRHRTLRATLDWSYETLSAAEQQVLRRLAVFAGSFDGSSAQEVTSIEKREANCVLDQLADLSAKSLMVADVAGDDVHYRLLHTTREYALEKLTQSGELRAVRRKHAALCASWEWTDADEQSAWHSPEKSIDDVRAALDWCFSTGGDACLGVHLIASSSTLWFRLSFLDEYRRRVEGALELLRVTPDHDQGVEMDLNRLFGSVALYTNGPPSRVVAAFSRALELAELRKDERSANWCLWGLHCESVRAGDYATALDYAERRARGNKPGASGSDQSGDRVGNQMLAFAHHLMGNQAQARAYAEKVSSAPITAAAQIRTTTFQFDDRVAAFAVLARLLWIQGFPEQALRAGEQAIDRARSLSHGLSLCHALTCAGTVEVWAGNPGNAIRLGTELMEFATRYSLGYWQQWARCICWGALPGESAAADALLANPSHGPNHHQTLATFDDSLGFDDAIASAEKGLAPWCAAELLRIKAVSMLRRGWPQPTTVEAIFTQAIEMSQRQGALGWELRSATSYAEFLLTAGRGSAAKDLLRGVMARCTEGQTTADFIAAQTVLKGATYRAVVTPARLSG